jgi:hypothetical protein
MSRAVGTALPVQPNLPEPLRGSGVAEVSKVNAALLVWLVFLIFGGSLLLPHYARIGYLPEVGLDESLSYLFAMSLIGGGVALLYSLLLFFPGVIWSESLILDPYLRHLLCYNNGGVLEPCMRNIVRSIGLPFALFLAATHFALKACAPAHPTSATHHYWVLAIYGLAALGLAAVGLAVVINLWRHLRDTLPGLIEQVATAAKGVPMRAQATAGAEEGSARTTVTAGDEHVPRPDDRALITKYFVTFTISLALAIIAVKALARIMDPSQHNPYVLMICTIIATVANVLVAAQFPDHPGRAVVTSLLAGLLLLALGELLDTESKMSERIISHFGVACAETSPADEHYTVTVFIRPDPVYSNFLKRLEALGLTTETDATGGHIDNVQILSRLGSEYFLSVDGRSFTLPRRMVLSWLRVPKSTAVPMAKRSPSGQPTRLAAIPSPRPAEKAPRAEGHGSLPPDSRPGFNEADGPR